MRILITGIAGFAGSHLAQYLMNQGGHEVLGVSLMEPGAGFHGLFDDGAPTVYCCDILKRRKLGELFASERPDAVMHLAAHAQVAGAWRRAAKIMETNAVGTQTLMQVIRQEVPEARVLLVSSGDVYGRVSPGDLPLTEERLPRPNNPYSVSKVAQEYIVRQYHEAFGMEVVIARPFNHIGPRQVGDFITPVIARQLAEMEAGLREPVIEVGNLDTKRDFLDVRDTVRAYHAILERGAAGEVYNVCSGEAHEISEVLSTLVGYADVEPELRQDPDRMRPADTPMVIGDNSKLRSLGGWTPQISLRQSLGDVLEFWRDQVLRGKAER